jgi:curli biogenesis system outer membrane secretion channel CsgG
MKFQSTVVFVLLLVLGVGLIPCARAQDSAPATDTKTYAVLTFETSDFGSIYPGAWWYGFRPGLVNAISDELTTALVKAGYKMVERSRLADLLKEQDLGTNGVLDPATAAKTGKVIGAQYLIVGTLTQWGMKERGISGINLPVLGTSAGVKQVTAEAAIDWRVVNSETGQIVMADTGRGAERNTSVTLVTDWYRGLSLDNNEWWGSQIGKATRKAVKDIVGEMVGKKNGELVILDMLSADEAVVEIDETTKLRKGDMLQVFTISRVVRNAQGKVILRKEDPVGQAQVEELQEAGAVLKIVSRVPGAPEVKAGFLVKRR